MARAELRLGRLEVEPAGAGKSGTDSTAARVVEGVVDHLQLHLSRGIGEEADRADDAARSPRAQ